MALTKERIVDEALAMLDEVGVDALTMRQLAKRLDVQPGALYWHYASKEALLGAMSEALLAGAVYAAEVDPGRWREHVTAQLLLVRRALLARRDGAKVFAGTFVAEPNTLTVGNTIIGTLRKAGLGKRDAAWAAFSLLYYIVGGTVEEQAARGVDPATITAKIDRARYADLAAVLPSVTSTDFDARAKFGLGLMLDGIERRLDRGSRQGRGSP